MDLEQTHNEAERPLAPASENRKNNQQSRHIVENLNILVKAKNSDLLMFLFRTIEIMQEDITHLQKMEKFLQQAKYCLKLNPEELESMKHYGE